MKIGEDGMQGATKCALYKNKLNKNGIESFEIHNCIIKASLSEQVVYIEVPDKNVKMAIKLQDMMVVINATNAKYRELREAELGTPLGTK